MENKNVQRQAGILGAAMLGVVISLLSMPRPLATPLVVALFLASVALPLNVVLFLSPDLVEGHTHPDTMSGLAKAHLLFYMIGFPAAFLCIAAVLWHLCVFAAATFLVVSLIGIRYLVLARRQKP